MALTPNGQLMLSVRELSSAAIARHQSFAWFSNDGEHWSLPAKIGDPTNALAVVWHDHTAFSVGYDTAGQTLSASTEAPDGRNFTTSSTISSTSNQPMNRAGIPAGSTCLCSAAGWQTGNGLLGKAGRLTPWSWRTSARKLAVAMMLAGWPAYRRCPIYDGKVRTSVIEVDEATQIRELLALPSGGDCSYPGLVCTTGCSGQLYFPTKAKTSIYSPKLN